MKQYLAEGIVFSVILALIVVEGVLLQPSGYFLALDWSFSPTVRVSNYFYGFRGYWEFVYAELPFLLLLKAFNLLVPGWILQRVIILLIFFLCGFSAYRLLANVSRVAGFFACILYCINPFVYVRFLSGQWALLLGYALLPLAVLSFMRLLNGSGLRGAVSFALYVSLVTVFSLHMALLTLLICLFLLAWRLVFGGGLRELLMPLLLSATLYLALNLYWLLPVLTSKSPVIYSFTVSDLYTFSAKPQVNNIYLTLLSMHGFWRGGYTYTFNIIWGWQYLAVIFVLLSAAGFLVGRERCYIRPYIYGFASCAAASLIFATGTSGAFKDLNLTLFENSIFFQAFRDTQKFITPLILSYTFLGGLGVKAVLGRLKSRRALYYVAAAALLALPVAYQFNMPLAFSGQLKMHDYPKTWYDVNTYLNADPEDFNTLFLPWHTYMHFEWAEANIANPADIFFDKPVIRAQNIEAGAIYTHSTHPAQRYLDHLLSKAQTLNNLGELLAPLNVKYILLAKEADYQNYLYLYNQTDLTPVYENEAFTIFRNEKYIGRIYQPESLIAVKNYDELIEISQKTDISRAAIVTNSIPQTKTNFKKINYTKTSPTTYKINEKAEVVAFTPPNLDAEGWQIENTESAETLGFQALYIKPQSQTITYQTYYRINLPAYITSASAFTATLYLLYITRSKPSSQNLKQRQEPDTRANRTPRPQQPTA